MYITVCSSIWNTNDICMHEYMLMLSSVHAHIPYCEVIENSFQVPK